MEYIITILGLLVAGLTAFLFKQNRKIKILDNDVKTKEYEVKAEQEKRKLATKKAALEGAKIAAEQTVSKFYSQYGHLIESDDKPGKEE